MKQSPKTEPRPSRCATGIHKAQLNFVKSKADNWAESVRSGFLKRHDVIPLLKTTILKSLEYPSALSTLSYAEWSLVMSKVLQVALPKAGICRSFPHVMVYALMKFQGLGIPHPFTTQLINQLDMLLRHPANTTQTWTYLSAVLQSHQLETGTSYGLLQQVYPNTAMILASNTWLKRVWRQLEEYDIYVSFDTPMLETRSHGDQMQMELFMEFSPDQETLKWLNWCRLYLCVTSVADLLTADGKFIRQSIWTGYRDSPIRQRYQWPQTERPSEKHWVSWRKWLTTCLLGPSGTKLRQPLPNWHDELDNWNWLYSPGEGLLFHSKGSLWFPYCRATSNISRSLSKAFKPRDSGPPSWWTSALPANVVRATTSPSSTPGYVQLTGVACQSPFPAPKHDSPSLLCHRSMKDQVTDFDGWVPDQILIQGSEQNLAAALFSNELCVVSDGSFLPPLGTAATILATKNGNDRIVVLSQTPGQTADQSPYRSKLIGILAGLMVSEWLRPEWAQIFHSPSRPVAHFACDGLSALRRSFGSNHLRLVWTDFDLLSAIRGARSTSALSATFRHVLGHRDRHIAWANLSWWEQRNVEADELAGAYRRQLVASGVTSAPNARFFTERSAWFIAGVKQSRLDVVCPTMVQRWTNKNQPLSLESEVDWPVVRRAMRSLRPGLQHWLTKHSVGMCGVQKFLKRWKHSDSEMCPVCGEVVETALHVPRCPKASVHTEWTLQMDLLSEWFATHQTDPNIASAILELLWLVRPTMSGPGRSFSPAISAAYKSQQVIGIQGLLEGRLSHHWRSL